MDYFEQKIRINNSDELSDQEIENLEQGLTITNTDGKFIYVNPSFAQMIGVTQNELIGLSPLDICEEGDEIKNQFDKRQKGKTGQFKCRISHNNRNIDIAVTGVPLIRNNVYEGSVAVVTDLSQAWNMQSRLKKNEILLEGVSQALQALIMEKEVDDAINAALTSIGKATNVDRVYIFKNIADDEGNLTINQRYEWCNDGVEPQVDNAELQNIPYDPYFMHWYKPLSKGLEYSGIVREFEAEQERAILEEQGILSILILPIFSDGDFWGFVGFDDCVEERRWTENEENILSALAAGIGSHIERAKNRDRIEDQKKFYENILNSIPSDIVVFSPDHKYQFVNPVAIKDDELRSWLIGKDDYDYCAHKNKENEIADRRRKLFNNVKHSGKTKSFEEKYYGEDGSEEWILRRLSPVYNDRNELEMMIGYGLDISERKKAEQELERSLEMVKHAQQIAKLGSWEYDLEKNTIYISDEAQKMFELKDMTELTVEKFLSSVVPEERDRVKKKIESVFQGKQTHDFETKMQLESKDIRFVNIKARTFTRNNEVVKIIGTILDITEKKKAELEIKSLAKFPEENPLPVLRVRPDGEWMYSNKSSESVKIYVTKHFDTHYSSIIKTLLESNQVLDEEAQIGDSFYSLTFTPVREFGYVNIYGKDITSRIEQEKELIKAREIAEESQRLKQKFLANMSHEIRTPMNGVIGVVNLLEDTPLNEEQDEYLNILRQSSDHLMMLINDILDVSKLETGKNRLINKPFDLKALIYEMMDQIQPQLNAKSLQWSVRGFSQDNVCFEGDVVRIRQILFNLITNAIKFTEEGNIGISYSPLTTINGNTTFNIQVHDTGIGIPKNDHDKIFDAFAQSDSGIEYKYGGTGLGLHIVRELVEQMNGEIEVDSTPGFGSTFSFTLTLKQVPYNACKTDKDARKKTVINVKRKILVVDDQDMNRIIAGNIIKRTGADIIYANNGKEAIEQLDLDPKIDIVMMDMQMPVMDGETATRQIRNSEKTYANVPIVAMTAAVLNSEREKCLHAGMNGYIAKPFEPPTVFEMIDKLMNERDNALKSAVEKEQNTTEDTKSDQAFDLSYLIRISDNNREFIESMLQTYIDDMPGLMKELEAARYSEDIDKAGKVAHKAKSMAAYVGAQKLQKMLKKLDEELESDKSLLQTIPEINQLAQQIYTQIENELS